MTKAALGVKLVLLLRLGLNKAASIAFGRQGGWVEVQDTSLGFS